MTGLFLCLAAIHLYAIELNLRLLTLFSIVVAGFTVHSWLKPGQRLPFVFLLNTVALPLLFGLIPGLLVLLFGLLLFGAVNLKLSSYLRGVICMLIGGGLALAKIGVFNIDSLSLAATVVSGLFMFRSLLFLYETHHNPNTGTFWERLNYFFLLPNLIFVIFPVVDLKTFIRTRQKEPDDEVYTKGLWWIMRGLFQLLVYRLIYYYLVPAPEDVVSTFGVIQFMITSYLMIVRLSGIFHLSTGMMCLFGFNLPPTFDNYFLATGFSDLWRRINVYWRDFMMKVFYFPLFFRFKKRNAVAVFISVMIVFVINWLLHQYQYFWITGTFPITTVDIIFWLGFGVLVAINSIYQMKGKKKKKKVVGFSLKAASITCLQVIGMFTFMSILWSFWTSPGIGSWVEFIQGAFPITIRGMGFIGLGFLSVFVAGVLGSYIGYRLKQKKLIPGPVTKVKTYGLFWLLAVLLMLPPVSQRVENILAVDLGPVRETRLNEADSQREFQGYYESLLEGKDLTAVGAANPENTPGQPGKLKDHGAKVLTEFGNDKRLRPNVDIIFKNARLTTNSFGLRDKEYPMEKPEGRLRVALLGGSVEMGSGVTNEETFEQLTENQINKASPWANYPQTEILNFALSGMKMANQVVKVENAMSFYPDVLIYALHPGETARGLSAFVEEFYQNEPEKNKELWLIFDRAGLKPDMGRKKALSLLRPFSNELAAWTAKQVYAVAAKQDAIPVVLFVPVTKQGFYNDPVSDEELKDIFEKAGFTIIDLANAFQGYAAEDVQLSAKDIHPNALGHRLIADVLIKELKTNSELTKLIEEHSSE